MDSFYHYRYKDLGKKPAAEMRFITHPTENAR